MEGVIPRTAFAWATSTTSSSSNPVVPALASSAAMIPKTAPLIKIPKAVLLSSPETTSTVALISERQDLSRSRFLHQLVLSLTGHYLIHVAAALTDARIPAVNGNDFYLFNIFRFRLHGVVDSSIRRGTGWPKQQHPKAGEYYDSGRPCMFFLTN